MAKSSCCSQPPFPWLSRKRNRVSARVPAISLLCFSVSVMARSASVARFRRKWTSFLRLFHDLVHRGMGILGQTLIVRLGFIHHCEVGFALLGYGLVRPAGRRLDWRGLLLNPLLVGGGNRGQPCLFDPVELLLHLPDALNDPGVGEVKCGIGRQAHQQTESTQSFIFIVKFYVHLFLSSLVLSFILCYFFNNVTFYFISICNPEGKIMVLAQIFWNLFFLAIGFFGIGFLITIHEFGHFIFCKLFDVSVPSFSIGFGPALWQKKIGETTFSLSAIPLGGYVEMAGSAEIGQGGTKRSAAK